MESSAEFLTPAESIEVDTALLTSRDKFSARVAIYSLRSLKQAAEEMGGAIAHLTPQQIEQWVFQDPTLQAEQGFDSGFKGFFARLVISSLKPLTQIAAENEMAIDDLTVQQVVRWFEKEAKLRLERQGEAPSLG